MKQTKPIARTVSKERHNASARKWYHNNKEKSKKAQKQWRIKNRERYNTYHREYQRMLKMGYKGDKNNEK